MEKPSWTDMLDSFKTHLKKLSESDKPYCNNCFDDRDISKVDDKWWCEDCLYIQKFMKDIKKIS